jgi:hypothetical protein
MAPKWRRRLWRSLTQGPGMTLCLWLLLLVGENLQVAWRTTPQGRNSGAATATAAAFVNINCDSRLLLRLHALRDRLLPSWSFLSRGIEFFAPHPLRAAPSQALSRNAHPPQNNQSGHLDQLLGRRYGNCGRAQLTRRWTCGCNVAANPSRKRPASTPGPSIRQPQRTSRSSEQGKGATCPLVRRKRQVLKIPSQEENPTDQNI